ncbi:MAG: 1,4-dihydroxy-6-naphthoate synthase [Bacteroidetes bacterium]|nr:MAG: 1,4-dihydroxy-6-naphthoate synthase [Bacteroidota bacterium]
MELSLAFSTCPNDTFIFDALVHGHIDTSPYSFAVEMADIFHLNQMAHAGQTDLIKISYNTFGQVMDTYQLLDAGGALGHNCGPLLISKESLSVADLVRENLPVAIPGQNTTANLLLGYYAPEIRNRKELIFHEIMPAVANGEVAAGVIIHENRFTYPDYGLRLIQDLGAHWEQQTGLPIPLGAIVAHKRLGQKAIAELDALLRESVAYAFAHPEVSRPYVCAHAQEMEESVMRAHIDLYVNAYSLGLGEKGRAAVRQVLQVGEAMHLMPAGTGSRAF